MERLRILFVVLFPVLGLTALLNTVRLQANPSLSNQVSVTFTVNSDIDATDANPGDGICETDVGNGICTLRAAVQETNALPGAHVILLPSGIYTITIPGEDFDPAVGTLNITDSVSILGEGNTTTIINGNNIVQIFDIRMDAGKEVTIADLTVMNGYTGGFGGGICHCTDNTKLFLNRVIVRENESFSSAGGIYNAGYMEVNNSTFQENIGGNSGGGILNTGIALIHKTNILSNTAPYIGLGGGILNQGVMTVTNTTINGNSVASAGFGSNGGGVFNHGSDAKISIENSTISRNTAEPRYGGFANYGGTARLINVTVSENTHGGVLQFNGGVIHITNTTIVSNTYISSFDANLRVSDGTVMLGNSILAGEATADNCMGLVISVGYNLESGNSCGLNSLGDITGTNPLIGPLQWNGGDTQTHALLAGSSAIDSGNDSICPVTDQRGVSRPQGDSCDIGAYEFSLVLTAVPDAITTTQNSPVLIDVLANDISSENGNPTLDSVGVPVSGTAVITDTLILYTPNLDFTGIDSFTYTITDGVETDTAIVTITVDNINDPPFFTSTPVTTAMQNVPYTYTVTADDPDLIHGDTLTITAPIRPVWLTLTDNGDDTATLSGMPTNADVGKHNIVLLVTDEDGLTDMQTFTVTVWSRIYLPLMLRNAP